jgi:hypothetical protein
MGPQSPQCTSIAYHARHIASKKSINWVEGAERQTATRNPSEGASQRYDIAYK